MLDLSIQKVYDICQAKEQALLFEQLCTRFGTRTYKIQMKKLFSKNRDTSVAKLALLNYEEKQNATQSEALITVETTKRKVLDTSNRPSGSKLKAKNDRKICLLFLLLLFFFFYLLFFLFFILL